MHFRHLFFVLLLGLTFSGYSQFAPPAGFEGTTAIYMDSSVFVGWGETVVIERGPMSVDNISLGNADYGLDEDALGIADNIVISLGDGGIANYNFTTPAINGEGPDFAVFENSFVDDFLELCFVEVSSDGVNFFRFEAISLTQTDNQVDSYGTLDATKIYNLGGKYRGMYGVPFDLEELKDEVGLDVNHIINIKLIDVVGSIDPAYATYDAHGSIVNDPWPTPFSSSGFDLDAVGIIHTELSIAETSGNNNLFEIYPNPAREFINLSFIPDNRNRASINIINSIGINMYSKKYDVYTMGVTTVKLDVGFLSKGIYSVIISGSRHENMKLVIID